MTVLLWSIRRFIHPCPWSKEQFSSKNTADTAAQWQILSFKSYVASQCQQCFFFFLKTSKYAIQKTHNSSMTYLSLPLHQHTSWWPHLKAGLVNIFILPIDQMTICNVKGVLWKDKHLEKFSPNCAVPLRSRGPQLLLVQSYGCHEHCFQMQHEVVFSKKLW